MEKYEITRKVNDHRMKFNITILISYYMGSLMQLITYDGFPLPDILRIIFSSTDTLSLFIMRTTI